MFCDEMSGGCQSSRIIEKGILVALQLTSTTMKVHAPLFNDHPTEQQQQQQQRQKQEMYHTTTITHFLIISLSILIITTINNTNPSTLIHSKSPLSEVIRISS